MASKTKICPQCGFEGSVAKYFGYRDLAFTTAQSWCLDCRNAPKSNPSPKRSKKKPMPRGLVALRREYKAVFGTAAGLHGAAFYRGKLIETGKYST